MTDRVQQCISVSTFNFFNKMCPLYMSDIFEPVGTNSISTRNLFLKLKQPFRKTNQGQNSLSYIGPGIWNKLPDKYKKDRKCKHFQTSF